MFREISESEIAPFIHLLGEVEGGEHYDSSNPEHVEWITCRVHRQFAAGGRFYALYGEMEMPLGIGCLLVEPQLHVGYQLSKLLSLGVFPEYRGRGHGSKLLGLIEEEARRQGSYCLYIWTYAANTRNVTFYGKNGYPPVATLPDTNGPGDEGDLYMRKVLMPSILLEEH